MVTVSAANGRAAMAECFTLCQKCDTPIGGDERAHQAHDVDCGRFLGETCRCDGWVCIACCPDDACGPLAAALLATRADPCARAEAHQLAAGDATASVERESTPPPPPVPAPRVPSGFYFGVGG